MILKNKLNEKLKWLIVNKLDGKYISDDNFENEDRVIFLDEDIKLFKGLELNCNSKNVYMINDCVYGIDYVYFKKEKLLVRLDSYGEDYKIYNVKNKKFIM